MVAGKKRVPSPPVGKTAFDLPAHPISLIPIELPVSLMRICFEVRDGNRIPLTAPRNRLPATPPHNLYPRKSLPQKIIVKLLQRNARALFLSLYLRAVS